MATAVTQPLRYSKPLLKAYLLGYLSSTIPGISGLVLALLKGRLHLQDALGQVVKILQRATAIDRFAAFCGVLVGGTTILQLCFQAVLARLFRPRPWLPKQKSICRITRFLSAFLASVISFALVNSKPSRPQQYHDNPLSTANETPVTFLDNAYAEASSSQPASSLVREIPSNMSALPAEALSAGPAALPADAFAGKTMDLTLFAMIRASDVLVRVAWHHCKPHGKVARALSRTAIPSLFSTSVATIMFAWFYAPHRLPRSYVRWISAAAELDPRLLLALRHARYGTWTYGKDTGHGHLLGSMCKDYGLPEELGDPAKTIPIPCELVHMGYGKSCEKHAAARFLRGCLFAAKMYLPINLLLLMRRQHHLRNRKTLVFSLSVSALSAARSSAFLGAFISLFYYGVCLCRTRLGPKLFSPQNVTPQMWDGGLCVMGGCILCGWSILAEESRRRAEILFFVLPKAIGVWLPRRYLRQHRWKEHFAFAFSTAVVFTAVQENPNLVQGMLGRLLSQLLI